MSTRDRWYERMKQLKKQTGITIFYSYASADKKWCDQLAVHLSQLKRDGLGAFVDHFLVRFWLWHTDCLPWNLIAFLDEAAEHLLLRKGGGSYIFVHRLLLEYFAALDEPAPTKGQEIERVRRIFRRRSPDGQRT